jgi:putative methanogenesis marker protein 3
MSRVLVDGSPAEFSPGATIGDLIPDHDPSMCVAVIRPGLVSRSETRQFLLKTTAGELVIETTPAGHSFGWSDIPSDLSVRWQDRVSVSFGSFSAGFSPSRRPSRYERGDVILGCGGYDPSRSVLVFARRTHSADHGASEDGGQIGVVIAGRGVIDRLSPGDKILGIEPVISFSESVDAFTTTDLTLPVSDGMQIISHIRIEVQGANGSSGYSAEAAESVELLLLALRSGKFLCDQRMSTHIRCDTLAGTAVPNEIGAPRREGAVMMRTSGKKQGSVYIYTEDLPRSLAHTMVGQVVHGLELARIAHEGDIFRVTVIPEKCDLVGFELSDALAYTAIRDISLTSDREGDGRMIISQDPAATLDVLSARKVTVKTVPDSQVIDIVLDDEHAPETCKIFRDITGLKFHMIGRLPLFFAFDDVFLFNTKIPKTTNIKPENTPDDEVTAGILAMTNESRKGVGMVGIRTSDNSEFGPTSEPFSGTNIIGSVLDLEKLEALKEGDMVYFREVSG